MTKDKDALALDADSSPDSLGEPPARSLPMVRRINNKPLIIAVGVIGVILCMFAYIVADRSNANKVASADFGTQEEEKQNINSSSLSYEGLISGVSDGVIKGQQEPEKEVVPEATVIAQVVASQPQTALQGPSQVAPLLYIPNDGLTEQQRQRIASTKAQRVAEAIYSRTGVEVAGAEQEAENYSGNPGSTLSRIDSYRQQLLDATKSLPAGASASSLGLGGASSGESGFHSQAPEGSAWALPNSRVPGERYAIKTGAIIPAIMISGVNSDLPGQVVAQVSQNVYDTATGYELVIPQGSRLVGQYNSNIKLGQDRVMLRWDRIILPDSSTYDLAGMPGADQMGYSGFKDKVNNHYWKIFGNAFLLSLISGGYQASLPDSNQSSNNGNLTAQEEISLSMAQQFNEVGSELVRRNLDIEPTIEIRPGYRFTVMVNKDMLFKAPYQPLALKD